MKFTARIPEGFSRAEIAAIVSAIRKFRPSLEGLGGVVRMALLTTLLVVGLELLRPWPVKILIDDVLLADGTTARFGLGPRALLGVCSASVLLLSILLGWMIVRRNVLVGTVGRKVTTRIRSEVYKHLQRLALPFHQSNQSGDLLVRLMGDVNLVRDLLFSSWAGMLERVLLFVGTAVLMFVFDWRLAVVAMLPIPFLVLGLTRSSAELTRVSRKQRKKEGSVAAHAAESLRQIQVVKAYAAEDRTAKAFTRMTRSSERAGLKAIRIASGMSRSAEVATGFGLALVLYVGAGRVLDGALEPGELVMLIAYARLLYKPIRKLSREGVRLSKATACAGRLMEILDEPAETEQTGLPVRRFDGALEFESVHMQYGERTHALRGIDLAIPAGSLVVLHGPNGAGKSTLISLVLRLIEPSDGVIRIDGTAIDQWNLDGYRSRIAYVPQELLLFGGTIRDNLLFARPDATEEELEEAVVSALAADFVNSLPEGLDTTLGEAGVGLSGGQGRRLMLARAALRDADILMLDEPLAGLDPESRRIVARGIRRIASGRTTIVISHDEIEEIQATMAIGLDAGSVTATRQPAPDILETLQGDAG